MTKFAVITGASSGIGAATAEAFAEMGWHLVIGARRVERLQALVPSLQRKGAASVTPLSLDVRDEKSTERFAIAAMERHGPPDVLLNNAGLVIGVDRVANGKPSDWETILDTNVMGVLRVTRAFLPDMIRAGKGHIVMLGSIAGHQVYEGGSAYCASKFALQAITKTLKLELNGTPIRVSTIDPGMVETEFSLVRFDQNTDLANAVYKGITPLTARDIADCIVFCATRPAHVNIDGLIVMPTDQATVYKVNRK